MEQLLAYALLREEADEAVAYDKSGYGNREKSGGEKGTPQ